MTTEPESFLTLMRAEMESAMSKLELRLVDRFAAKKDLEDLDKRVTVLEKENDGRSALSTWQRWLFGGLGFATVNALVYVAATHIH